MKKERNGWLRMIVEVLGKALWLGEVGELYVVGRLMLTTIMWLNQIPPLLSSPLSSPLLLCLKSEFGLGHMFRYGC